MQYHILHCRENINNGGNCIIPRRIASSGSIARDVTKTIDEISRSIYRSLLFNIVPSACLQA